MKPFTVNLAHLTMWHDTGKIRLNSVFLINIDSTLKQTFGAENHSNQFNLI